MKRNVKTKHKTYFVNICAYPYDNWENGGAIVEAQNPEELIHKMLKSFEYEDRTISMFSYTKNGITYSRVVVDMRDSHWVLIAPEPEKERYFTHWYKIWE